MKFLALLGALALTQVIAASVVRTRDAVSICCSLLASSLPNTTFPRDDSNSSIYAMESTAFWSSTAWLDPSCVFLPETESDLSLAMSIFTEHSCPFAIRGGGHSANRGAASIDDGILVTMRRISDIVFNADRTTVAVGAGNTWADIYSAMEAQGYILAGGRFATVGTGLLLGAGLSYFTNEVGMSTDGVVGHRVVLPDGRVVTATPDSDSELHWALKGGGNNFGIVTHFIIKCWPSAGVLGGRVTYPTTSLEAVQELVYTYQVQTSVEDLDVHILPTYVFDSSLNATYASPPITYNRNATALPPSLQAWLDVPYNTSTIQNRTFTDLATELVGEFADGFAQIHYSFSVYPSREYLTYLLERFSEVCSSLSHFSGLLGLHTVMPIPPQAVAIAAGNNPLGMSRVRANSTLTVIYVGLQYNHEEDTAAIRPIWQAFIDEVQETAQQIQVLFPYIMMTYSDQSQAVIASYGDDSVCRLRQVQQQYDPDEVFQHLVPGGPKLPAAVSS